MDYSDNTAMKILYAGMMYDYGDPSRGLSFEHYNFHDTLCHMEHEIIYFDCMSILKKVGRKKMNEQLLEVVEDEDPDLLFCILMEYEFDPKIIQKVTNQSRTITFNWFCDDHWRYDNFSKFWAPHFNWVSTTDEMSLHKYQRDGVEHVIKTQWGVNPFLYQRKELPVVYDVSFVGQVHSNRRKIVKKIEQEGIGIQCFGADWPNGRISQEKMIDVFNQSKINLNLSNSSTNKWYRFWKKDRNQIKGRNFEVPGCGGFLLTGKADFLEDYFEVNSEIGVYDDENDIIEKIMYFLDHEDERNNIASAGFERCVDEHSYVSRFNNIFSMIF